MLIGICGPRRPRKLACVLECLDFVVVLTTMRAIGMHLEEKRRGKGDGSLLTDFENSFAWHTQL